MTMFHRAGPNVIENDEGVSVEILGRMGIRYREGGRSVDVESEVLATPEIAVYVASIRKWSDGDAIDAATRSRIIENIQEAVRSQGENVVVI
jgi:hypothetical protein